jgi:hypothetical protein
MAWKLLVHHVALVMQQTVIEAEFTPVRDWIRR